MYIHRLIFDSLPHIPTSKASSMISGHLLEISLISGINDSTNYVFKIQGIACFLEWLRESLNLWHVTDPAKI